jgi:hypothetical protein
MMEIPKSDPIDPGRISSNEFICLEALGPILAAIGLPLSETVDELNFLRELNLIIFSTFRQQIESRYSSGDLRKMKKALLQYDEMSKKLAESDLPPPIMNQKWLYETMAWFEPMETVMTKRGRGGPAEKAEGEKFYPQMLGLFHACTGEKPSSTIQTDAGRKAGATGRFIMQTITEVRKEIRARGFSSGVSEHARFQASWPIPTDSKLEKNIQKALKKPWKKPDVEGLESCINPEASSGGEAPELQWEVSSQFYKAFICEPK